MVNSHLTLRAEPEDKGDYCKPYIPDYHALCVIFSNLIGPSCYYRSLIKECPLMKEHPPPYFWPNFLYRVKVYSNECPPWSELCVEFEKHSLKCYARNLV